MDRYTFTFLIICGWFVFFKMFPGDFSRGNKPPEAWCGTVMGSNSNYNDAELDGDLLRGKIAFEANCARCHNTDLNKNSTGPALYGVSSRMPGGDWIYRWVANSSEMIREGDPYAVKIWTENNKASMDPFPSLPRETIDDIMAWIDSY